MTFSQKTTRKDNGSVQTLNDIIHNYTVRATSAQYQQKNWNCVSRRASPQAAAVRKREFLIDYSGIE